MSFLSPWALLWLASIPVLVWLWRLASTRRQLRVASLVPFEQLLKRPPRRRSRLFVNVLFWLQLAALLLLTLALMQPIVFARRAKTTLVLVDTSASMGAEVRGRSVFDRARQRLRGRLARKAHADRWLVVASAPASALSAQPTGDPVQLGQAIDALQVNEVGGNLGTAAHLGRALLGGHVDRTLVVTDEPQPLSPAVDVEFLTVGEPLPNVAIVGVDAEGPLCSGAPPRLLVSLQNFSNEPSPIRLSAEQHGRRFTEVSSALEPHTRTSLSLTVPEDTDGWVDVTLETRRDALAVDNHAQVMVRRAATLPIAVVSDDADFHRIIGRWLAACEGLVWSDGLPAAPSRTMTGAAQAGPPAGPYLVVTDREDAVPRAAVGTLRFLHHQPAAGAVLAHWVAASSHPISAYLSPVGPVAASLGTAVASAASGEPVVWGLLGGQRVPIVLTGEEAGHRSVSCFIDPDASPDSTSLLIIFFNSVRWLMGQGDAVSTGEPLLVPSLDPGAVKVRRPDGSVELIAHEGGVFRYDATTRAGFYRITSGRQDVTRAANFIDPLESDMTQRASTWRSETPPTHASGPTTRVPQPLTNMLVLFALAILMLESWCYCRKRR